MTLKQLQKKRAEAHAAALAIANAHTDTLMSTEQKAAYEAAIAERNALDEQIAAFQALQESDRTTTDLAPGFNASVGKNRAEDKPWKNMGEQLLAIMDHGVSRGQRTDPRLQAALGQNENVEAEGGFALQAEYSNTLMQTVYETGILTSRCAETPMSSRTLSIPGIDETSRANGSRNGGIQAYWEGEAQPLKPSQAKLRLVTLTANKITALTYLTHELMEDGPAVQAFVERVTPDELSFQIDSAIYTGTGAGQPLGFLNSPALVIVPKVAGQAAGTLVTQNVLDMRARMPQRCRANAAWFITQDMETQLLSMTLGSGTAVELLYTPPGFKNNTSQYGLLLGSPVVIIEQASAIGQVGDIVYADLTQYILGKRNGVRTDSSIHVAFLTDEVAFRFIQRLDGQSLWRTPLGQFNGGNLLSPFVALQAR